MQVVLYSVHKMVSGGGGSGSGNTNLALTSQLGCFVFPTIT